jgi:hypothetical protein
MTSHLPRRRHHLRWLLVVQFFTLAVLVAAAIALSTGAPFHETSAPTCSGPITITTGGTYTGCWSTTRAFAVTIATSDPVTITNSTLKGATRLIGNSVPHVKLTVTDSKFYGMHPLAGTDGDYAVYLIGFDYAHIEHNSVTQKGGFKFGNWTGTVSQPPVIVRYNLADNIDGRLSDGAGGYSGVVNIQFVQLDHVNNAPGVDISWNQIHNTPYQSAVADNMNMYCSSGTPISPIDIHDNFIDGAYPMNATAPGYTGGGILLGDNDADIGGNCNGVPPAYMVAHDNQVIHTTNYGISALAGGKAGGHDLTLRNNMVIDSGLLPGTSTVKQGTNVGVAVWDGVDGSPKRTADVAAYGNTVGWWQAQNSVRNDWWLPACSVDCANSHYGGDQPEITRAGELDQFTVWKNKLAANEVTTGPDW